MNNLLSPNQITRACSDGSFYSLPVALSFHQGVEEGVEETIFNAP